MRRDQLAGEAGLAGKEAAGKDLSGKGGASGHMNSSPQLSSSAGLLSSGFRVLGFVPVKFG
jgi:hypothetical protein